MRSFALDPPTARRRPLRRRLIAGAAAAAVVAGAVAVTVTANAALPPPPSGWTQVWADDFTGAANTLPSSSNWIIRTGHNYPGGAANWGTGEIQNYTDSTANVSHDGAGNLRITPLGSNQNWTSSRIETVRSDFKAPAGGVLRMEGRIRMPNVTGAQAAGYWPAFWALGAPFRGSFNWPAVGEFDVMENVNGINSVSGALHCGVAPGGPCNEFNGLGNNRACPGSTCQSAFHTYSFEWDRSVYPNQLRWYVDGQQYHAVTQNQVGEPHWSNMTNHAGYFLLLNVAMGGALPNGVAGSGTPTAATVSGRSMLVDYVAVYSRGTANHHRKLNVTLHANGSGVTSDIALVDDQGHHMKKCFVSADSNANDVAVSDTCETDMADGLKVWFSAHYSGAGATDAAAIITPPVNISTLPADENGITRVCFEVYKRYSYSRVANRLYSVQKGCLGDTAAQAIPNPADATCHLRDNHGIGGTPETCKEEE